MAQLNAQVTNLANAYKKAGIVVDVETKTGKPADGVYANNLLEGLTPEIVELVRLNDSVHLAAATKAVGEASLEACSKNKDLGTVTTVVPMTGKDTMNIVYTHEKQVRDMKANDGTMMPSHGHIRAQFNMYGEAGNRGQLAVVRNELAEAALAKASK